MKDTDKITLTIGQLKKLISESRKHKLKRQRINEYETYEDEFGNLIDDEGNVVSGKYAQRHRVDGVDFFDEFEKISLRDRRRAANRYSDPRNLPGYGDSATWGKREPR